MRWILAAGTMIIVLALGSVVAQSFLSIPIGVTIVNGVGDTTTTVISCDPTTIVIGGVSACTATVVDVGGTPSTPTGTVAFTSSVGIVISPVCTLGPSATCTVGLSASAAAGSYIVTGSYSGDVTHEPSAGTVSLTVVPGDLGNSGFENGSLSLNVPVPYQSWGYTEGGSGSVSITTEDKHSGARSLKVVSGTGGDYSSYGYVYQASAFGTTTFTFGFWYKGVEGSMETEALSGWTLGCGCGTGVSISPGYSLEPDSLFPVDGKWHHAVVVHDSAGPSPMTSFYLDDVIVACTPTDLSMPPPTSVLLGDGSTQSWWGTFYFDDVSLQSGTILPAACPAPSSITLPPGQNQQVDLTRLVPSLNVTISLNVTVPVELRARRVASNPIDNPVNRTALGVFLEITANRTITLDARIRFYYNESQVHDLDERSLGIYVLDNNTRQWIPLESMSRDLSVHWVEGTVHHFSLFGLFSQTIYNAVASSPSDCWYCVWWIWATTGGVGTASAGAGLYHRRTTRNGKKPRIASNPDS